MSPVVVMKSTQPGIKVWHPLQRCLDWTGEAKPVFQLTESRRGAPLQECVMSHPYEGRPLCGRASNAMENLALTSSEFSITFCLVKHEAMCGHLFCKVTRGTLRMRLGGVKLFNQLYISIWSIPLSHTRASTETPQGNPPVLSATIARLNNSR